MARQPRSVGGQRRRGTRPLRSVCHGGSRHAREKAHAQRRVALWNRLQHLPPEARMHAGGQRYRRGQMRPRLLENGVLSERRCTLCRRTSAARICSGRACVWRVAGCPPHWGCRPRSLVVAPWFFRAGLLLRGHGHRFQGILEGMAENI